MPDSYSSEIKRSQRHLDAAPGPAPFFMDTPRGPMFAIHHRAAGHVRGNVLCVPPFNEEMNRCRSMITLQARALATQGIGTLLLDPHGTGDSAGSFVDGRWSHWHDDLRIGVEWLMQQPGGCRGFWGIRLGAILAAEAMALLAPNDRALILWQPVLDGKQHLTQFLRVRLAAQMDRPDLPKETTSSMRAQFAAGQSVEIGGYEIHPELAAAIDGARLASALPSGSHNILWVEQPPPGAAELGAGTLALVQAWRDRGLTCNVATFDGPSFWQLYERVLAQGAIEATTSWAGTLWKNA